MTILPKDEQALSVDRRIAHLEEAVSRIADQCQEQTMLLRAILRCLEGDPPAISRSYKPRPRFANPAWIPYARFRTYFMQLEAEACQAGSPVTRRQLAAMAECNPRTLLRAVTRYGLGLKDWPPSEWPL